MTNDPLVSALVLCTGWNGPLIRPRMFAFCIHSWEHASVTERFQQKSTHSFEHFKTLPLELLAQDDLSRKCWIRQCSTNSLTWHLERGCKTILSSQTVCIRPVACTVSTSWRSQFRELQWEALKTPWELWRLGLHLTLPLAEGKGCGTTTFNCFEWNANCLTKGKH